MRGHTHEQVARNEERAQAMWLRYAAGESLRTIGAAFGVRAQTVHAAFRVRGWVRRRLSEAQMLGSGRRAQQQLLLTLVRLHVACEALGCVPATCDRTLEAFDVETQARMHARAKRDLVLLLGNSTAPPTHSATRGAPPAGNAQ